MRLLSFIEALLGIMLFGVLAVVAVWLIDRDRTVTGDISAEETRTIEFFREMNQAARGRHRRPVPANAPPAAVLPDVVPGDPGWEHLARNWTDTTGSFKAFTELREE